RVLADDGRGVLAAEGPATFTRLAAGARRDVPFAPTDSAVAVAHLDNDRFELGEGAVRQNVRTYQRQSDSPQPELLQLHCPSLNRDPVAQVIRSTPLIWLRCMTRRVFGSNGSRLWSTERLFHISRSPTFHS